MICRNCGVDMVAGAAFCPSCGKPADVTSGPSPDANSSLSATGLQPNIAALLCYLAGFLTGIFFLAVEPYKSDRFVRFHAFQSIFLSIAWFVVYVALGVFLTILPGPLWHLGWVIRSLFELAFFLLWVLLMYKAYNNEQFKLPAIGDLAAKQARSGAALG